MSKTGGQRPAEARAMFADQLTIGVALVLVLVPAIFDHRLYDDFTLPKQALLIFLCLAVLVPLLLRGNADVLPAQPLVRWAFIALCAWTALSWLTGIDPRGSLLGVYQYRQGALTFACYAVLFLAGSRLARREASFQAIAVAGSAGLATATIYTIIQSTGHDPVDWWLDTSVRAIGTIGNANELASYAMVCLAFGGAFLGRGRSGYIFFGAIAGAVTLIVLESESRTGIIASVAFALLVPALCLLIRSPVRTTSIVTGCLVVGMAAGAILSSQLGAGASAPAGRVQAGLSDADGSGSTRISLVKGTLPAIAADPLTGAGPDGLYLQFPKARPDGLTGVFEQYDLTVQSSHNWILDTAANLGVPGLLALVALLASCGWVALRQGLGSRNPSTAVAWAGMLAYGAMTLANPLSLAGHAIFWLLLGWLGTNRSHEPGVASTREFVVLGRRAVALIVPLGGVYIGVTMPIADLVANQGWNAYAREDFTEAAEQYARAHSRLPIVRDYRSREGRSWLAAGIEGGNEPLERAESVLTDFKAEYAPGFDEQIALATAKIALRRPVEECDAAIDDAVTLNPKGVYAEDYAIELRKAARNGGVLEYEEERHWVLIRPLGE